MSGFSGQRDLTSLNLAVDDAMGFLQKARARTLSSEDDSRYGVHFETNKFVLFAGDTYNASDPTNKARDLSSPVEINAIALQGGVVDIVFKRLTGETNEQGTVTIRLSTNPSVSRVIKIESTGLSYIQ